MKIEFSAEAEVPDGTPLDDVERWLEFELGAKAYLSGSNAMAHSDLHSCNVNRVYVRVKWMQTRTPLPAEADGDRRAALRG